MKKTLLLLFVLSQYLVAGAVTYDYLTFDQSNGTSTSVPTEGLTITFNNGNLVASDGTTIALSSISKMYFSDTSSIHYQSTTIAEGPVDVFSITGNHVGTFDSGTTIKDKLPKGVYLMIPAKGKATKIVIP